MDISTENTFTDTIHRQQGGVDVAVGGTFVGTISVLFSKDNVNWFNAASLDGPGMYFAEIATAWFVRVGFETGNYTSGTAEVGVY